jgi:hypothetical protein
MEQSQLPARALRADFTGTKPIWPLFRRTQEQSHFFGAAGGAIAGGRFSIQVPAAFLEAIVRLIRGAALASQPSRFTSPSPGVANSRARDIEA